MKTACKRYSNQKVFGPKPLVAKPTPWNHVPRRSQDQVRFNAAQLRQSLQNDVNNSLIETKDKKVIDAANQLLLMAKDQNPSRFDCGKCANCLDKPRFGGAGSRKQKCSARKCKIETQMCGKNHLQIYTANTTRG